MERRRDRITLHPPVVAEEHIPTATHSWHTQSPTRIQYTVYAQDNPKLMSPKVPHRESSQDGSVLVPTHTNHICPPSVGKSAGHNYCKDTHLAKFTC